MNMSKTFVWLTFLSFQAIGKDSTHFKAYFNRGFSFDKIGEYDRAIEDYSKAVQLDPSSAYAYYNR